MFVQLTFHEILHLNRELGVWIQCKCSALACKDAFVDNMMNLSFDQAF